MAFQPGRVFRVLNSARRSTYLFIIILFFFGSDARWKPLMDVLRYWTTTVSSLHEMQPL